MDRTKERIIILDPDPQQLLHSQRVLENLGYAVLRSRLLSEVVEISRVESADLLLIDLSLEALEPIPEWERRREDPRLPLIPRFHAGYAVLRPLEKDWRAAAYPIVRLKADDGRAACKRRFGVVDFVTKPLEERHLLIKVRSSLETPPDAPIASRSGRRKVTPWKDAPAIEGGLGAIKAPELLQMLHVGHVSGDLVLTSEHQIARLSFSRGEIVDAVCGALTGPDAVYAVMHWRDGRFELHADQPSKRRPLASSFHQLLLEGCLRLDEIQRAESDIVSVPMSPASAEKLPIN